jgi:putative phosphoesterase
LKIALIGDVHGNIFALNSVLDAAERAGVSKLLITGDLIGYYFWPKEVFNLLSKWDFICVQGNHEQMFLHAKNNPKYLKSIERKYGSGLKTAMTALSKTQHKIIENFPLMIKINLGKFNLLLCHGSPWDHNAYIYPDSAKRLIQKFKCYNSDFIVLGHTHYPMHLNLKNSCIINPGSVGQPRTKNKKASWAILDTDKMNVTFHSEKYKTAKLLKECGTRHPDLPYLADILT